MREQLDTRLYEAFLAAAADREQIKVFRDLAAKRPTDAAAAVCDAIPQLMQDTRQRAHESYGIDLADQKWNDKAKQRRLNLVEGVLLLMAANLYLVLEDCQSKLDAYASDTFLSGEEWATKVLGLHRNPRGRCCRQDQRHRLRREAGRRIRESVDASTDPQYE
jgi:hypothetical protein